jgi:hypothetical protein
LFGKFEKTVVSITEIMRRYTPYLGAFYYQKWHNNSWTENTVAYTTPTAACHPMMAFYAGWAGSLKFRFIVNDPALASRNINFFPYSALPLLQNPLWKNYGGYEGFIYFANAHTLQPNSVSEIEYQDQNTGSIQPLFYHSSKLNSMMGPYENMYPVSVNTDYVDVTCPYQQHYNFLQTYPNNEPGHPHVRQTKYTGTCLYSGLLTYTTTTEPGNSSSVDGVPIHTRVWTCGGDDFTPLIFRPPLSIVYQPIGSYDAGHPVIPPGAMVDGWRDQAHEP